MTLRPAENQLRYAETMIRQVVRVKRAAEILDLSVSSIYQLIDCGELEAHYAGRGRHFLRIYLDSISAFQERKRVHPTKSHNRNNKIQGEQKKKGHGSAQFREAMAYLEKIGVLHDHRATSRI